MHAKTIATILAVLASLALPVGAGAHKAHLSMAHGEAMIRANAMLDQPTQVILSGCHRDSLRAISCFVREIGAHTLIYDNGEAIVGNLSWEDTATI